MSSFEQSEVDIPIKADKKESTGSVPSLPDDVLAVAGLRTPVVSWTALDPAFVGDVESYTCCCIMFGPFAVLTCFLPYLLLLWPCFWAAQVATSNDLKSQYWILTETELKVINKNHDVTCIPGCCQSGESVKTIPLDNITDCGVVSRVQFAGRKPLPTIYVDTASSGHGEHGLKHEATGVALADYHGFLQAVLKQRDIVKGISPSPSNAATATAVANVVVMERGLGVSGQQLPSCAAERIEAITKLFNDGVLTQAEFGKKRQEIIDSI